jgi:hypothetical protein
MGATQRERAPPARGHPAHRAPELRSLPPLLRERPAQQPEPRRVASSVRFVIGRDGAVGSVGGGGSDLPDSGVVIGVVRGFYGAVVPAARGRHRDGQCTRSRSRRAADLGARQHLDRQPLHSRQPPYLLSAPRATPRLDRQDLSRPSGPPTMKCSCSSCWHGSKGSFFEPLARLEVLMVRAVGTARGAHGSSRWHGANTSQTPAVAPKKVDR